MTEQQYTTPEPTSSGYGAGSQPIVQPAQPQQPVQFVQPTQGAGVQPGMQPQYAQGQPVGQQYANAPQPTGQTPKKKGKKGKIVLAVVLVLVLGFVGINAVEFYLGNHLNDGKIYASNGDSRLCDPRLEVSSQADKSYKGNYSVDSYLLDIGVHLNIYSSRYDIEKAEGKQILKTYYDGDTKNVIVAEPAHSHDLENAENNDLAFIHMNNPIIKEALDTLLKDSADCTLGDQTFNTVDEVNELYEKQGQKVLQSYKAFKATLIPQIQAMGAKYSGDFSDITSVKNYAAHFGLTTFIEFKDGKGCVITEEDTKKDTLACVHDNDNSQVEFATDSDPSRWSNSIRHEVSHHLINLVCGDYLPMWDDLKWGSWGGGDYSVESIANAFAVANLGASTSLWMDPENVTEMYLRDYTRHPKDDEALNRINSGDCHN